MSETKEMTKKELISKLKLLDLGSDKEKRNSIACSLIGHSRICSTFFGYRNCGRCGDQIGDNLGSVDPGASKAVIIGHACKTCKQNYEYCTWKDKLYVVDPFKEEA